MKTEATGDWKVMWAEGLRNEGVGSHSRAARFLLVGLLAVTAFVASASAGERLERDFAHPPDSARPWVYWFWLNGNITSNGITADLEAMKRVGIGGVLIMEVDQGAPVGPVDFGSEKWRALFRHVHSEARRLGLEVNMNNDAGWNGSGGPWIKPEESMQKIVWTETNVPGPCRFEASLPQPETVAGFYRDIAVLAFPTPATNRIERIRVKAAFEIGGVGGISHETAPPEACIGRDKVQVLQTTEGSGAGQVAWDVPAGDWTILRIGRTSTGVENAPAPKTGRGLECDKLSKTGIEANFAGLMEKLAYDNRLKPGALAGRADSLLRAVRPGLMATHIDSWENGSQNWSTGMRQEFQKRRGYDLLLFLPVLTGRIIGSLEISERFLWDLRQTVSELVIENYAGGMRELAHAHGMRFTVEAYGSPCDSIPYAGQSDEPMGEFWTPGGSAMETCKAMASAGHIYGKPIIGAESFTSGDQEKWREHPAVLKALGDRAFCEGINRFVFHRYALQPWPGDRRPGMTMGPWGQHYERTETWWDFTRGWHEYLARCQFLLRQGLYVADICYLQPEAPPQGPGDHKRGGYAWDECTADAVLNRMSVKDGRIILPDGMSYRVLVLPHTDTVTPRLLRKISELVQAGATVLGPKPTTSPSLTDYPKCDQEVKQLAAELWADCDGERVKEHRFGQGQVVCGIEAEKWLEQSGVAPDFASAKALRFIHRAIGRVGSPLPVADLYFVSNPENYELTTTCSFRVIGKNPEFWWPEAGRVERAAVWKEQGAVTHVAVPFEPSGSLFVVFRERAVKSAAVVAVRRNGKVVLSAAPEPPTPIFVTQARYGILDDPQRTRDVKQKVQAILDGGESSLLVRKMADGDDPAPEIVKTLVVDYTIEGKRYTVKGTDPTTLHIGTKALNLRVEKASYGVLDDTKRTRNVREKLQQLVDAGESSFKVSRMAEGDDPAVNIVKSLVMEATVDGKHLRFTGTDPEILELAPAETPPGPPLSVRTTSGGRLLLETREPGEYEWETASGKSRSAKLREGNLAVELSGPWKVSFAPGCGVPRNLTFDHLVSWSEHPDPAVRYFSGSTTYSKSFSVPSAMIARGKKLYLDLGKVQVMAQLKLNGRTLGTVWKPPFRLDISGQTKSYGNTLEVRVVNLWPNRMIGDEQLPEDSERNPDGTLKSWPQWLLEGKPSSAGRFTFTSWRLWKKGDALLQSGLIGPVQLQPADAVEIKN